MTACAWRRPGSRPSCAGEIVPLGAAAFCAAPKARTSSLYSRNSVFRRSVYCSTAMGSTLRPIWRYDKRSRKYRLRELERTVRLLSAPRLDELVVCRAWHYHDARISSYLSLFRNWTRLQGGLRHDGHLGSWRHSGGVFPRNTVSALHGLGTAIPFVLGNASLITLALSFGMPALLRLYTFLSGVIALLGLVVYASGHYLGLGEGGIERVVAYPQTVCLAVIGFYLVTRSAAPRTAPSRPPSNG
jgi:hypothetical protein